MSRQLKTLSALLLGIGMGFIVVYLVNQNPDLASQLSYPSYYVRRTYIYIFVSGACGVIFAVMANFFSWMKKLDINEDVLSNAGFVSDQERTSMVTGSTLDTMTMNAEGESEMGLSEKDDRTELLDDDRTEILDRELPEDDKTEILDRELPEDDETEILTDQTEVPAGGSRDEK